MSIYRKPLLLAASFVGGSWLVWSLATFTSLIEPNFENFTRIFVIYALVIFGLIYAGMFMGASAPIRGRRPMHASSLRKLMFWSLSIGVLCRAVDRFIMRPVGNIFSISSIREARLEDSNLVSVIGTLAPAVGVTILALLAAKKTLTRGQLITARVIAVFYLADLFLTGSRGISLIVFLLVFGITMSIRTLLVIVPLVIVAFGAVFLSRFLDLTGTQDLLMVALNSSTLGYAHFVPASDLSNSILQHEMGVTLFFPILQIAQYAAHGIFEFADAFSRVPDFLAAPGQFVSQIPGLPSQQDIDFRRGLYYSLPGTLVLSFGKIGALLVALPLGIWLGRLVVLGAHHGGGVLTMVGVVIFGIPFVNTVGGFDLIFYLVALYFLGGRDIFLDSKSREIDGQPETPAQPYISESVGWQHGAVSVRKMDLRNE